MARKGSLEQGAGAKRRASGGAEKEVIFSLTEGTPIYVNQADICTAIGKTKSRVSQMTGDGIFHKTQTSHGAMYDLFETVRAYCTYLEGRSKKANEESAEFDLRKKKADAEFKEAKAEMAMLEAAEFQGKMHRSEDVQAMTADLLFYIRGSLTALAGRCATDCAASSEPAEVQKIIEREVFKILKELSEYKYDSKRYDELVKQRMNRMSDSDSDLLDGGDEG